MARTPTRSTSPAAGNMAPEPAADTALSPSPAEPDMPGIEEDLPAANPMPGAAAPAASAAQGGLATPAQVLELADQLSACADQIHERVMRDIRAYAGRPVPDKIQATARALLEDEILLRQRANGLHADAAAYIVKGLGKPQAQLVKLTTDAAEKIRKIGVIGETVGLVAGLLALAGAAASGQPVPVLLALEKVEKQAKALGALAPKPPATKA